MKSKPRSVSLTRLVLAGSAAVLLTPSLYASVFTWAGTGENSPITNFNAANSWVEQAVPGPLDSGTFVGLRSSTVNVTTSATTAGLGFDATSYGNTLSTSPGAVLTFKSGAGISFLNKEGALNEISANMDLSGGNCQFAQAGGTTTNLAYGQGGTLILSGNITGSGTLTLARAGASSGITYFTLSGSNSFTGGVRLSAAGAVFNIANANALGSGTFQVLSTSGQTVNNKTGAALTINNNMRWASGAGLNIGDELTSNAVGTTVYTASPVPYAGDITFNGDITLVAGNGASSTFNIFTGTTYMTGVIGEEAASRAIRKDGAGTLVLSGSSNTFSGGFALNVGTAKVAFIGSQTDAVSSFGVGSSTLTIGNSTSSAYLVYTGKGETTNRSINILGTSGTAGIANEGSGKLVLTNLDLTATGNKIIALGGSNSDNNEIQSVIKNPTGFTTTLIKNEAGKWILSGANTYTGITTINGGTLQFGKKASLYNGDTTKWTTTNLKVNNAGSTLAVNVGGTDEFAAADVGILLALNNTSFQPGTAFGFDTTNASGGSFTYDTAITNAGTSSRGITKLGSGILSLGGDNSYTGATRVEGGQLNVTGALAAGSAVSVLQGATLGGSGTVNGAVGVAGGTINGSGLKLKAATTFTGVSTLAGTTEVADVTVSSGTTTISGNTTASSQMVAASGAKLNVDGSITGSVKVDGALGGSGSISGATQINGRFAPGNSIGTLSTGSLAFGGSSVFDIELGVLNDVAVSDRANVTGTVDITSGATLNLTLSTGTVRAGDMFFLISNDGTDTVTGSFVLSSALGGTALTEGSQFSWSNQTWQITYRADAGSSSFINGNDVAIMAVVPEPGTWALLTGGFGMLVAMQGIRRRAKVG